MNPPDPWARDHPDGNVSATVNRLVADAWPVPPRDRAFLCARAKPDGIPGATEWEPGTPHVADPSTPRRTPLPP